MTQRIYIIGAGAIAGHHAEAIARLSTTGEERPELSITDAHPAALAAFAERFPWVKTYPDTASMLNEPAQADDVVIVATPPVAHAELSCLAFRSGRHVLCEKPLAMNKAEADRMLGAAREAGKLLGCCSSRFAGLRTTAAVKTLLAEGKLGRPYRVNWIQRRQRARTGIEYQPSSRWFLQPAISGGGTLMDWGPYDIAGLTEALDPVRVDVLDAWMADPLTGHPLQAEVPSEVEQHVGATLRFHLTDGGAVPVHYERAACCHGGERSLTEIEGTAGAVGWDWLCWDGQGDIVRHDDTLGEPVTDVIRVTDDSPGLMDKPIVYFLDAVAGRTSPAIVGDRAAFNFGILCAIYDCIRTGEPQTVAREGAY
ncbi:Gfo/Idh/MocA family protein [Cohnella nanjingensis]|uniref:Gfo/Idh/MocA family oxidoreductase n=1 Tax=Cohnella nanjingensis TaxID=1387779 RepID=A0A7X0RNC6_9BACL|nr:Gfo/Idh/MocA family oxidoreductase [Cohnella nanjingensis]MBB6670694.1 Gfo/Idh/MocA family oxidoreductase [Cohnella nanjingensis]